MVDTRRRLRYAVACLPTTLHCLFLTDLSSQSNAQIAGDGRILRRDFSTPREACSHADYLAYSCHISLVSTYLRFS